MQWYDVGAYLLMGVIVGVACAVLYLIFVVVRSGIEDARERAKWKGHPTAAETPFGPFRRVENVWYFQGQAPISIAVDNLDGAPDPAFVECLPAIMARLSYYEELAREAYDFEGDLRELGLEDRTYNLEGLSQGSEEEDFVLSFNVEEEVDEIGSVYVSFRDGKVAGTVLVH